MGRFAPGAAWTLAALLLSPAQWLQFRLNPQHDAAVPGTLSVSWRIETGAPFSSSPTLAGGVLYIGNNAGRFYAIDPVHGRILWTYRARESFMSNPIVAGGVVIAGEGNQVSYHDPHPGADKERLLIGTGESAIVALDARTGRVRWRAPMRGSAMPTGAIVGGVLVEHNGYGDLTGIDPKTGRVLYSHDTRSIASMSAVLPIGGDRIATTGVTYNETMVAHARSGAVVWRRRFGDRATGLGDCPLVTDGSRLFCNYLMPPDGQRTTELRQTAFQHMFALDARLGVLLWDVQYGQGPLPRYNEASIPLVDRGTLFCGSSVAPYVVAFEPLTGRVRWRLRVRGSVKGGIAVRNGVLYFGDGSGYLWAVEERTGRAIGSVRTNTTFNVGSPIVAGQTLVIGSYTGAIIAMPLSKIRGSS